MILSPNWERNEAERAMSTALEKVAKEVGAKHITAVAIAYLMQKTPYVFPIIGGRKVEQLEANIESLSISLTPEQMKYLESIVPFDPGFPHTMIVSFQCRKCVSNLTEISTQGNGSDYAPLLKMAAYLERQPPVQPIVPDAD